MSSSTAYVIQSHTPDFQRTIYMKVKYFGINVYIVKTQSMDNVQIL